VWIVTFKTLVLADSNIPVLGLNSYNPISYLFRFSYEQGQGIFRELALSVTKGIGACSLRRGEGELGNSKTLTYGLN
jgi:hypothetical protein